MSKVVHKILEKLPLPVLENHKSENTVLLSATRRSGSTWLQEFLNRENQYRLMFEPFHPFNSIVDLKTQNQHLFVDQNHPDTRVSDVVDSIMSGRIGNRWVNQYNRKILVRERLIKSVRSNLLLPYICSKFPETKVVFLIRHPFPTVFSRMQLGWKTLLEDFEEQEALLGLDVERLRSFVEKKSIFEQHLLSWCLEHWIPIQYLEVGQVFTVFYEDLVSDKKEVVQALLRFVSQNHDSYGMSDLSKPSAMVQSKKESFSSPLETINRWRSKVDQSDLERGTAILESFGFGDIYDSSSMRTLGIETFWQQVKASKGSELF